MTYGQKIYIRIPVMEYKGSVQMLCYRIKYDKIYGNFHNSPPQAKPSPVLAKPSPMEANCGEGLQALAKVCPHWQTIYGNLANGGEDSPALA
ncbi:hypothetical protein R1flu_014670 [Riccia fluitans]|uniref:Uncharacterized protein n=1 Tax=Riccia fluitans TaxID=41844 RepID=A0ABD1YHW1_9MARC